MLFISHANWQRLNNPQNMVRFLPITGNDNPNFTEYAFLNLFSLNMAKHFHRPPYRTSILIQSKYVEFTFTVYIFIINNINAIKSDKIGHNAS